MKGATIVILLSTLILSGCKKYPEGGNRLRTENKIIGAYWINAFRVNGVDSSLSGNPILCRFSFLKSEPNDRTIKSSCGTFPTNSWEVTNDNQQISITFSYTSSATELYPFAINKDITVIWDIQRLKKDDLWLKTNLNGREYYLELRYYH